MSTVTEKPASATIAVGAAARAFRQSLGLSLKQMAAQIDVPWPVLVQYETGALAFTEELLAKFRDKFQVEIASVPSQLQPLLDALHQGLIDVFHEPAQAWLALTESQLGPAFEQTPPAPAVEQAAPAETAAPTIKESAPVDPAAAEQAPEQSTPPVESAEIKEFVQPTEQQTGTPSA